MSDNYPVEQKDLTEKGTKGIMSAGAGVGLLGINALLGIPVLGWVLSAGLLALGAVGLFGKTKTDKVSGTLLSAAGIICWHRLSLDIYCEFWGRPFLYL